MAPTTATNYDIITYDSITPAADDTYNIGQYLRRYRFVYTRTVVADYVNARKQAGVTTNLTFGAVDETGVQMAQYFYLDGTANGSLTPSNTTFNIGSTTNRVQNVYSLYGNFSNTLSVAGYDALTSIYATNLTAINDAEQLFREAYLNCTVTNTGGTITLSTPAVRLSVHALASLTVTQITMRCRMWQGSATGFITYALPTITSGSNYTIYSTTNGPIDGSITGAVTGDSLVLSVYATVSKITAGLMTTRQIAVGRTRTTVPASSVTVTW
jgi:hypothetical protein